MRLCKIVHTEQFSGLFFLDNNEWLFVLLNADLINSDHENSENPHITRPQLLECPT